MKLIITISLDAGTTPMGAEALKKEITEWIRDEYEQDINKVDALTVPNGRSVQMVDIVPAVEPNTEADKS